MKSFASEPVDFHILTGYLGSGKTTLLRHHLSHVDDGSTAVIINEFGDVSLDHRFVMHAAPAMEIVAGGCMCCTHAGELKKAIVGLLAQRAKGNLPNLKRIVLETSGLANPAPLIATLLSDFVLKDYSRLASCVVTIDATDAIECAETQPGIVQQIVAADRVVITKLDLTGPGRATQLKLWIRSINPMCEIIESMRAMRPEDMFVRGDALISQAHTQDLRDLTRAKSGQGGVTAHSAGITSYSMVIDEVIDWPAFSIWLTALLNRHGHRILRFKGLLDLEGETAPVAIHGVRHRMYPPEHLPESAPYRAGSELVFITEGIPGDELSASLLRFLRRAHVASTALL